MDMRRCAWRTRSRSRSFAASPRATPPRCWYPPLQSDVLQRSVMEKGAEYNQHQHQDANIVCARPGGVKQSSIPVLESTSTEDIALHHQSPSLSDTKLSSKRITEIIKVSGANHAPPLYPPPADLKHEAKSWVLLSWRAGIAGLGHGRAVPPVRRLPLRRALCGPGHQGPEVRRVEGCSPAGPDAQPLGCRSPGTGGTCSALSA